jgi:glycosyltransferase involved in cell wall biosynthesis
MVVTRVGGVPEIFGPDAAELVEPNAFGALADAIHDALKTRPTARTERLQRRVAQSFTVAAMTDGILAAYADALASRPLADG